MNGIKFKVPGSPVAQPRPRATSVNGRARMYEAKKTHAVHSFKATVRMAAEQAYQGAPLDGPLFMSLTCVLPRPGKPKKRSDNPPYYATKKPDLDNLMKSVADALSGILYRDDKQIAEVNMVKTIAAASEQPHVEIEICELDDEMLAEAWRDGRHSASLPKTSAVR